MIIIVTLNLNCIFMEIPLAGNGEWVMLERDEKKTAEIQSK